MNAVLIYCTTNSEANAREIGKKLIEERLVACINIVKGMQSIYRWEDTIHEDTETVFIAKTREELVDMVTERIKILHPYSCPCIVALPITGGNSDFLNWIYEETGN